MIAIHTRSICDACCESTATIQRKNVWLCDLCDSSRVEFEIPSASSTDVNAATVACQPPAVAATNSNPLTGSQTSVAASPLSPQAVAADVTNSKSSPAPAMAEDDGHWPATADPADPVAVTNSDAGCALCGSLDCDWTHGPHADPLSIPEFLRRDADNVAPFVRKATALRVAVSSLIQASASSISPT